MGVVNQFEWANGLCRDRLHFEVNGDASYFRSLLDRAGKRRFELCIQLIELWQRPGVHGLAKYERLKRLLELVTPGPAKLRNPQAEAARQLGAQMDAEAMNRAAVD